MKLLSPDANTDDASSASSAAPAIEVQSKDANGKGVDSSSTSGANGNGNSEGKIESIGDLKKKFLVDHPPVDENKLNTDGQEDSPTSEKDGIKQELNPDGSVKLLVSTEEEKDKGGKDWKEVKDAKKPAATTTDDSKLPFHNHPRFVQLTAERKEALTKLAVLEPKAQRMDNVERFCETNKIAPKDYDDTLRLLAEMGTNPESALVKIEKIADQLRISLGKALPVDLQKKVDDAELSLTAAQEMNKLRAKNQLTERQLTEQRQGQVQRAQQELISTLNSWTQQKISSDPSFKPRQDATSPEGKYELVLERFESKWRAKPPTTSAEATTLAEVSYNEITAMFEHHIPKPQGRRRVASTVKVAEIPSTVDTSKSGWARSIGRKYAEGLQ